MTTVRIPAATRRRDVVAFAAEEFAVNGFRGGSMDEIARVAGVSQPYLFRLFGTKRALFLAAVHECFEQTRRAFEEAAIAANGRTAGEILRSMGLAYAGLLGDRTVLRLQLQAYAASADPEIRLAVRDEFDRLYLAAAELSGADDEALHGWFAEGMVMNVQAALAGDVHDGEPDAELLVARGGWLARLDPSASPRINANMEEASRD